jgi:hypothetical protein
MVGASRSARASAVDRQRRRASGEDSVSPQEPVTAESIDRLCTLAQLPLPAERRRALAPMLAQLVAAANELSRKMSDRRYRAIVPILRFPER